MYSKENFFESVLKVSTILILVFITYQYLEKCNEISFVQDDAYTSFRYAKNFVDGKGLVFNEGEKVEGYTNFSWVMILSFIYSINLDLESTAQSLSIFFGLGVILLTYFIMNLFLNNRKGNSSIEKITLAIFKLLPGFILAFSAPMIYWSVSAMETTLFVLLTGFSIYLFLKNDQSKKSDRLFIAVSILNSLTRPEGLIVFILIMFYSYMNNYHIYKTQKFKERLFAAFDKRFGTTLLYFLVPILFFFFFRLIYYSYPFPNTFYAKTSFNAEIVNRGIKYFLEFAETNLYYGLLLILPGFTLLNKSHRNKTYFFYYFVTAYIFFIIIIGGDVLPVHRFFLPLLPCIFIFCLLGIIELVYLSKTRFRLLLAFISIAIVIFYSVTNYNDQKLFMYEKRSYEAGLVKKMKIYAKWVKEQSKIKSKSKSYNTQTTVALSTIGAFSFFSNAKVIDLVGLTDEYTSHNPKEVEGIDEELPVLWKERIYNADYVLSRNPEYIIFPAGAKPSAFAECALFVQKEFYQNYYMQLIYSEELKQMLPIFTKRYFPLETSSASCNVKFIKYFIEANNLLLSMISQGNGSLIDDIISKCDSSILMCGLRKSDVDGVKGMVYYHAKMLEESKKSFEGCIANDPFNMAARFYLFKIYSRINDLNKMIEQLKWIKSFSPDALPYLFNK